MPALELPVAKLPEIVLLLEARRKMPSSVLPVALLPEMVLPPSTTLTGVVSVTAAGRSSTTVSVMLAEALESVSEIV